MQSVIDLTSPLDPPALAHELMDARAASRPISPPSARYASFDVSTAYAVEAELVRLRTSQGRRTVGRKVGYANKALWRMLNLETLVWAHMYDDTVHHAADTIRTLSVAGMVSPKIEPEIVFKLKGDLAGPADPVAVLAAVEWIALGFEIIDCPFPEWSFQPADFVAAFGLHAALVVGTPRPVDRDRIDALLDDLARFKVRLLKDDQLVAEGAGRNVLRSPALCLTELVAAISRRADATPLAANELVSSGTLTESQPIASGETWTASLEGLELPSLTVRT
jgi:2-keto-4-pentenoate hydratase